MHCWKTQIDWVNRRFIYGYSFCLLFACMEIMATSKCIFLVPGLKMANKFYNWQKVSFHTHADCCKNELFFKYLFRITTLQVTNTELMLFSPPAMKEGFKTDCIGQICFFQLCCPSVLCLFHCVHALLCTAGGECCSFELSEAYSGRFISPPSLSLSSGHGESNCGETLPQIDCLNMEASVKRGCMIEFWASSPNSFY